VQCSPLKLPKRYAYASTTRGSRRLDSNAQCWLQTSKNGCTSEARRSTFRGYQILKQIWSSSALFVRRGMCHVKETESLPNLPRASTEPTPSLPESRKGIAIIFWGLPIFVHKRRAAFLGVKKVFFKIKTFNWIILVQVYYKWK